MVTRLIQHIVCFVVLQERFPDLAAEQELRAQEFRAQQKAQRREQLQQGKEAKRKREEEAKLRSYSYVFVHEMHGLNVELADEHNGCCRRSLFSESKMTSNTEFGASEDQSAANAYEDDFM